MLRVVRCVRLLSVVCYVLIVDCWLVLKHVCWLWFVARCVLFVVCCLMLVVLVVGCCLLFIVVVC